jgi:hypothetical protein
MAQHAAFAALFGPFAAGYCRQYWMIATTSGVRQVGSGGRTPPPVQNGRRESAYV